VGLLNRLYSNLIIEFFRLDNIGLLADNPQASQTQNQLFIESEFSLRTQFSLDPDSGIKWSCRTRLEELKEKSFHWAKSLKEKLIQSRTTELCLDIKLDKVPLTCTKSIETTLSVVPFHKCILKWLVDTVPEVKLSTSSRHPSFPTLMLLERPQDSSLKPLLDIQRSLKQREPQLLLMPPHSQHQDQLWSEHISRHCDLLCMTSETFL